MAARRCHPLRHDFTRRQVARQTALPRGAKDAAHGAARLGADANRPPLVVKHQNGFDGQAIWKTKHPLDRMLVRRTLFVDPLKRVDTRLGRQPVAHSSGQVRHLARVRR
jgi:hypothetical protein